MKHINVQAAATITTIQTKNNQHITLDTLYNDVIKYHTASAIRYVLYRERSGITRSNRMCRLKIHIVFTEIFLCYLRLMRFFHISYMGN